MRTKICRVAEETYEETTDRATKAIHRDSGACEVGPPSSNSRDMSIRSMYIDLRGYIHTLLSSSTSDFVSVK
jgi:hypothetical protein